MIAKRDNLRSELKSLSSDPSNASTRGERERTLKLLEAEIKRLQGNGRA